MASMSGPTEQRYAYFDHEADMGIVGHGITPEAAMESAAEATFALMAGLDQLEHTGSRWRGSGWGEPWHRDLERGVEVKGATLTMLAGGHCSSV
jgi:hypothetical protein